MFVLFCSVGSKRRKHNYTTNSIFVFSYLCLAGRKHKDTTNGRQKHATSEVSYLCVFGAKSRHTKTRQMSIPRVFVPRPFASKTQRYDKCHFGVFSCRDLLPRKHKDTTDPDEKTKSENCRIFMFSPRKVDAFTWCLFVVSPRGAKKVAS